MASVIRRAVAGLRWILIGAAAVAVVAGAAVGVATVALGHTPPHGTVSLDRPIAEWSLVADSGIDRIQAMDAAEAAVPDSRAVAAEFETEHRGPVWEVEVVTSAGVEYEVTVDANTGKIIGTAERD